MKIVQIIRESDKSAIIKLEDVIIYAILEFLGIDEKQDILN